MAFELSAVLDVKTGVEASGRMAEQLDRSTTLVVVDGMLVDTPGLGPLMDAGTVMAVAAGEPTVASVQALADRARSQSASTVVAIGGGSALDTGKITAAMLGHSAPVTDFLLCANPVQRSVRLIAVPTTAGSGAEVTRTCVLSHEGRKSWMWDEALVPDTVVLDPTLTVGMPEAVTVATGLDAFVHAVEAFTNVNRDNVADKAALAAIATIPTALPRVVAIPEDIEGRRAMLESATTAGVAIDRCNTALAHCVGHAIAGFSKIPHGLAVALGLRATVRWSIEGDPDRYAAVAGAMQPGRSLDALVDLVDELYEAVGFEAVLRRYTSDLLDPVALAAAMDTDENRGMAAANARAPRAGELLDIAGMVTAIWNRP
ncbi:MAG: iron-containing alcohol dehydrogenase [Acidimicrobiia bacterium]